MKAGAVSLKGRDNFRRKLSRPFRASDVILRRSVFCKRRGKIPAFMCGQAFPIMFLVRIRKTATPRARTFVAACLASVALFCGACKSDYPASGQQKQTGEAGGEARTVKVARVAEVPVGASVSVTGALAAQDEGNLSGKVPRRPGGGPGDFGRGGPRGPHAR